MKQKIVRTVGKLKKLRGKKRILQNVRKLGTVKGSEDAEEIQESVFYLPCC